MSILSPACRASRLIAALGVFALLGVLSLGATPALAGVALSVSPDYGQPTFLVGQTGTGTLTITNKNDGASNELHQDIVTATSADGTVSGTVTLVPSCGSSANNQHCPGAAADPGVIQISSPATGSSVAGNSCTGDSFTVAIDAAATGEYMFTRTAGDLIIPGAAFAGGPSQFCQIEFIWTVVAVPTKDSIPVVSGKQTSTHAGADALDGVNFFDTAGGVGGATLSFPEITTTQTPTSGSVDITQLNDTASIVGVVPDQNTGTAPFGTVTFSLFDPDDPTCTSARYSKSFAAHTQCTFAIGTGLACGPAGDPGSPPAGSVPDKTGTWTWVASYTGDVFNPPISNPCTGAGAEPVTITKPVLTIQKTPDGTTYKAGDTVSFTIVVTNQGPGTAVNVHFDPLDTLPVPAGSTLSWSLAGTPTCSAGVVNKPVTQCTVVGNVLSCSFGDFAENANCSVTVSSATSASVAADCSPNPGLENLATAVADNADPVSNPGNQFCTPQPTTLTTTPQPASGTLGVTQLNDKITLSGGLNPTGTVTVKLFDPTQVTPGTPPTCNEPPGPVYTKTFALTGAATPLDLTTTDGPLANKTGTWQWTASYAGDANNLPSSSDCGAEPVTITQPVLTIQKTPDGTTYNAGDTVSFTIVVTNQGPGTAVNVHFDPLDTLPVPAGSSLSWSLAGAPTCSAGVANKPATQCTVVSNVLSCSFGDFAENANCSVTVSSATSAANSADCVPGNGLQNTATAVADNAGPVSNPGNQSCTPLVACEISKTCMVEATYECTKPITSLSMELDSGFGQCVRIGALVNNAPTTQLIDDVCPGTASALVTVNGYDGSLGNNVIWNICAASGGVATDCTPASGDFIAQSSFHLSCSDADMNSADDCNKLEGDNKGNVNCLPGNTSASCLNVWHLAGIGGPTGTGSDTLQCPGFGLNADTNCAVVPSPYVCLKPITTLAMIWDEAKATGTTIFVRATVDNNGTQKVIGPIMPGDKIEVMGYDGTLGNDVYWDIYDATNTTLIGQSAFHLSCSDPDMNSPDDCNNLEGDAKGNVTCSPVSGVLPVTGTGCVNLWTFRGMAGPAGTTPLDCTNPSGTGQVTYTYVVTNKTPTTVTGVDVKDKVTDSNGTTTNDICLNQTLPASGTFTCKAIDLIGQDTSNVASASGGCTATSNTVIVTVQQQGAGCPTGATTLTTKDHDVKWKVQAPQSNAVTISKIEISWDEGTNGVLQEVKRAGDSIFKGSLSSPATITTFSGDEHKRTIDKGKTDEIKFHFKNKPVAASPYNITITFTNGCKVNITVP
jgi:uncharacterized repeat protein (TIGR01451 family)